jgi:hypothetical protein
MGNTPSCSSDTGGAAASPAPPTSAVQERGDGGQLDGLKMSDLGFAHGGGSGAT